MSADFLIDTQNLPIHWIGSFKDWQTSKRCLSESLVHIPLEAYARSTLLLGNSGSGKTTLMISQISHCIQEGQSIVVLDMRGNLVADVLELCAGQVPPEKVLLYDLREKSPRHFGFSPLYGSQGEPYYRALNVLDIIAEDSTSWGPQLAECLRMTLMLLSETNSPITTIESVFYDSQFRESLLSRCRNESVLKFWQRYGDHSIEKQAQLAQPVCNKTSIFNSAPSLKYCLGSQRPEDLRKWLDLPGSIILVSAAIDETHSAGRIFSKMFFASASREIFGRFYQESRRNPVRFFIDESEHYFGMAELESMLVEGRKWKASVCMSFQNFCQAPPRIRSLILSNVGLKCFFRNGREEGKLLSKDLTGDPNTYDFSAFPVGEAIVWRSGHEPIWVEMNEPLIKDSGYVSHEAKAFIEAVKRRAPRFIEPLMPRQHKPRANTVDQRIRAQHSTIKITPPKLEDWL